MGSIGFLGDEFNFNGFVVDSCEGGCIFVIIEDISISWSVKCAISSRA